MHSSDRRDFRCIKNGLVALTLAVVPTVIFGCNSDGSSEGPNNPDASGSGGLESGNGGTGGSAPVTGGRSGTGGKAATGGASDGGASGDAGPDSGGIAAGGATGAGGATSTGGANGTGAATSTGGVTSTGGATGTGGANACSGVDITTDLDNCGACKAPCADGVIGIAYGQSKPVAIAVDATNVYWSQTGPATPLAPSTGLIMKAPKAGGAATILATGQTYPSAMTVDAKNVYWTNSGVYGASVASVPIAGGATVSLATGQSYAAGIAIDATNVYWVTSDAIRKVPKAGGTVVTLSAYGGTAIAIDATSAYWTSNTAGNNALRKVPLAGGNAQTLAQPGTAGPISVYGGYVYFSGHGTTSTAIFKLPVGGGTSSVLVEAGEVSSPTLLVADATGVYWSAGYIYKVPLAGGAPERRGSGDVARFALDGTTLYWTTPKTVIRLNGDTHFGEATCSKGVCGCPQAESACPAYYSVAGLCTDTKRDDDNCGKCGTVCSADRSCQKGVCTCPVADCFGSCVDTTTDKTNCGQCGVTCAPGKTCQASLCK